jgi:uncharacterized membrane protein YdjX (TVP38/TMEM64 family)
MEKPLQRRLFISLGALGLLGLVLAASGYFYFRPEIPDPQAMRESAYAFLRSIPTPLYFVAFALLPACGVPLTIFYLTAVPVMGATHPAIAILLGWTAVGLNMALTNVLARGILHPLIEWVIRHKHLRIPKLKPHNEWRIVLATRLSPIPFAIQNYLLALGHARWRSYLWLSLLIQGVIGTAVMLVGESILTGGLGYILLALSAFLVLHLVFDYLRKRLGNVAPKSDN